MEYLLFAVILYFIVRTAGNLVGFLAGSEGRTGTGGRTEQREAVRDHRWEGPSPRKKTGSALDEPTFWAEDIEDATWHEIDDGSPQRSVQP